MKKFIALPIVVFALIGLARMMPAGPEPMSGKEMKEVAPAPSLCDWTGFYGGLHVGFGGGEVLWWDDDFGDREILTHEVPTGVFGGAQLGYNHQFGSWLVLGIEGEFEASDVSDKQVNGEGAPEEIDHFTVRNNWNATVGLRAGVTSFNNRLFSYVKAGVAIQRWEYDWIHDERGGGGSIDKFGTSEWRAAPMVGFGLEYAFNCRWSANIEYKHLFLGSKELTDIRIDDGSPEEESFRYELHQDSVQVGINYKFWSFR